MRLRIGVGVCFFHADPARAIFKGKTLLYFEQSMLQWIMGAGALPVLIPPPESGFDLRDILSEVDGVLLQGGSDVSPTSYGETPLRPEWEGDRIRDDYERQIVHAAMTLGKPLLGVCRGLQILNVALGGSLYQDITHQNQTAIVHRDWNVYDELHHGIRIEKDSALGKVYGSKGKINSIHHQGIKQLAPDLVAEAWCEEDGIIEAVRLKKQDLFMLGVQWHPEFIRPSENLLPPTPLLAHFLDAIHARKV